MITEQGHSPRSELLGDPAAQLSTRCPFSLVLEPTSLPISGYYNKNDATEGHLAKHPHLSKVAPHKIQKMSTLPWLPSEHGLFPNVSASCPFLKVTQMQEPFPRGEEHGQGT